MRVKIHLFAMLREQAGSGLVEVEVDEGSTVSEALRRLGQQHQALAPLLEGMPLVMAVDGEYSGPSRVLTGGDELALIPPVSGGAPEAHVRVHDGELSADHLVRLVTTPHSGAIVTFQGRTRDVEWLEYEAYMPMAEERIAAILTEIHRRHEIEGIAAEHRVGPVALGESSVVVAVAAAHRGAAFAAARQAIDRIKAESPIWKREIEDGRAEWVAGTPPPLDRD